MSINESRRMSSSIMNESMSSACEKLTSPKKTHNFRLLFSSFCHKGIFLDGFENVEKIVHARMKLKGLQAL
jgi:hypothetical protein